MAETKVPLLGRMPKGALFAGGAAVVAVGGYLAYKHFTKPKTTTPPAGAAGYGYGVNSYGYGTNVPYGYGYGYGSYNAPYGTTGFGGNPYPYYGYTGGTPTPTQITTNAQWGQAAESAMGSTGSDSIAAAIAKYLFGGMLSEQQAQIVQEAVAVVGYPPQAGPANYPPQMHVSKSKGGGGGSVAVPNVVGQETGQAVRVIEAYGLTASHPRLEAGHGSQVTAESPKAGTKVKSGSNVSLSIREKK